VKLRIPVRPLAAALALGMCLALAVGACPSGLSWATVPRPVTRQQAAHCLAALSRGAARAIPGGPPAGLASAFGIFARAPSASDQLAGTVRPSASLGAHGAAAYYPAAARLLRRDAQDALYVVPAMLGPVRSRTPVDIGCMHSRRRAFRSRRQRRPGSASAWWRP
jgi:hypothetical protein